MPATVVTAMPAAMVAAVVAAVVAGTAMENTDRVIRVEAAVEAIAVEPRRRAVDVKRSPKVRSAHRTSRAEVSAGESGVAETRGGRVSAERA